MAESSESRLRRTCGIVRLSNADEPFHLECGGAVAPLVIAYETYGTLTAAGDNAVLVCHALTGSAHAAGTDAQGKRGWWHKLIGPGRAIDTDRWFVICSNVLGGCYGSTGPNAIDGATGRAYGAAFPEVTIRDMVRAQRLVVERLGVEHLAAVIGGSMGGMQVLEWPLLFPECVGSIIPIATAAAHSPWGIAFNAIAREAIALGAHAGNPEAGLRLARKAAMISYRSSTEWAARFGRSRDDAGGFAVESYLDHHGDQLVARFDATTYRLLTHAMDAHDVAHGRGSIEEALGRITQPALVIGITSDVLYPVEEQETLAALLPNARCRTIESVCGHDAFLIATDELGAFIRPFLDEQDAHRLLPHDCLPLDCHVHATSTPLKRGASTKSRRGVSQPAARHRIVRELPGTPLSPTTPETLPSQERMSGTDCVARISSPQPIEEAA